jgi:phosphatidylglycerophosphatase A
MTKSTDKLIVWLAQGSGIGRIPFAPGTWGSVLGVAWFLLLVAAGNWWVSAIGSVAAVLAAVWICGRAEEILQRRDPPSVVLDEIVAMPMCFPVWAMAFPQKSAEAWGGVRDVMEVRLLLSFALIFALFRLFDIWKPWPVRQSQRLPGGWGVVLDDLLAAVYVNLVLLAAWGLMRWVG